MIRIRVFAPKAETTRYLTLGNESSKSDPVKQQKPKHKFF